MSENIFLDQMVKEYAEQHKWRRYLTKRPFIGRWLAFHVLGLYPYIPLSSSFD